MRSRWAATVALAAIAVLLANCSSNSVTLNPTPTLTAVFPDTQTAGGPAFTLNLIGTNFLATSQVFWNGSCVQAASGGMNSCAAITFNASTQQLSVTVPAVNIAVAGSAQIMVVNPPAGNPPSGGGQSNSITFPILSPNNPVPTITSLSQQSAPAGGASFGLMVNGTNFISTSVVNFDGSPRTTSVNSATQLTAVILAQDLLCAGADHITVTNPAPGGGTSNSVEFDVTPLGSALPCITALSPFSANAGAAGFPLTVSGTNFNASSAVKFGANARVTTFNPATGQLTASLLASDLANSGIVNVTVVNTVPVAGTSAPFPFTINAAASKGATVDRSNFPQVVSVSASGGPADGSSSAPAMSADGRYVAFFSEAKNLVAEGTSGNVFVRDTCLGATGDCTPRTIAVDLAPDGSAPNGPAAVTLALSADGRFLAFATYATNLLADTTPVPVLVDEDGFIHGNFNLFVRDLCLGKSAPVGCLSHSEIVSADPTGAFSKLGTSAEPAISADGRFVAFTSSEPGLVAGLADGRARVFVRDTCNGTADACSPNTLLASVATAESDPFLRAKLPAISSDGRFVTFTAYEPGVFGSEVRLRDTCRGESAPADCLPFILNVSIGPDENPIDGYNRAPSISADGRFVAFQSITFASDSTGAGASMQILLRDTCLGPTSPDDCVPSTIVLARGDSQDPANNGVFAPQLSPDARFVSYSAGELTLGDLRNGSAQGSMFVIDTCQGAGAPCGILRYPLFSAGSEDPRSQLTEDGFSQLPLTLDGRFVVFSSSTLTGSAASDRSDVFITTTPIN